MSPPAMLSPSPVAAPAGNAPAPNPVAPRDAGTPPFGQQLQAARDAQSARAPAPAPAPAKRDTPAPQRDAAANPRSDAAPAKPAKPAEDKQVSNVTVPATTPTSAPGDASAATATPPPAPGDGSLLDAALAAAQAAAAQASAGASALADTGKPLAAPKSDTADTPDDDTGAAALAGAMLAMLGQVNGTAPAAPAAGKGAALDPNASRAPTTPPLSLADVLGAGDKGANAANAANGANPANAPPAATAPATTNAPFSALLTATSIAANASTDAHKDSALEALALAAPALPPTMPAPAMPTLQIATPPGQPGFANELGQQVIWLGRQDVQSAKITLHPEDLGSIDVHLSVNHDRVDVVFAAQHPAAVTAVQQSLPQLQQMLAQHGLALGNAEVGQQQQQGNPHTHRTHHGATTPDEPGDIAAITSLPTATSQIGLLDAFA